ncbi:DUF7116 family protein [Natronocalculus amylovorans]|uniref:Uncharacterized protein n=1 Tax=Natronocalculus amylovorans TaxID=2917812 RepID=A0AAE3K9L4_9EURY|nr:hypothetical protein [Natronocalculus amylovorans]MCL9816194.1 hypothetical protein [Natronocalculus amylovorans]
MATVTMPPSEEARTVFKRLGYAIDEEEMQFIAERKWRRVLVTPMCESDVESPERLLEGEDTTDYPRLRCFVTWKQSAETLLTYLRSAKPPYDWAIIGVDRDGDFEVVYPHSWA